MVRRTTEGRVTNAYRYISAVLLTQMFQACLFAPNRGDRDEEPVILVGSRDVDILFVIDNSGSMAEEQQRLAANFHALIKVLEAKDVEANYRIGITTTDSGNPRCPGTTPEHGALVLSSCLDRVDNGEFTANDGDFSEACTANCARFDAQLKVLPTTTQYETEPAPRGWIERFEGVSNIEGVGSIAEAFACYGPQGVQGCGFESPLASMHSALVGTADENSANYGFLRESALLAIVIVTDEADCSYRQEFKDIFMQNKTFLYDPINDVAPSSSVCWAAGVECSGDSPYEECHTANYGIDGSVDVSDPEAVLTPVTDYIKFVKELEVAKQRAVGGQRVLVSLIAGVPRGYDRREVELEYKDDDDEQYQSLFGIGPGCVVGPATAPIATAVPPVREREFAEAFADPNSSERNLFSICQDDYSDALGSIATKIRERLEPSCMPKCVRDRDPETVVVEPNCQLYEDSRGVRSELPECIEIGGVASIPAGATACYNVRSDRFEATASTVDDMTEKCINRGANLEFALVRSTASAEGATVSAICELSDDPAHECPAL